MSVTVRRSLSLCESTLLCQGSGLAASLTPRSWHEQAFQHPDRASSSQGCLMSLSALHSPSATFSLVTIPFTVNNQLLDEHDALFLGTNKCTTPSLRLQHLRQFLFMGIKCLLQLLQGFSGCKLGQLL